MQLRERRRRRRRRKRDSNVGDGNLGCGVLCLSGVGAVNSILTDIGRVFFSNGWAGETHPGIGVIPGA